MFVQSAFVQAAAPCLQRPIASRTAHGDGLQRRSAALWPRQAAPHARAASASAASVNAATSPASQSAAAEPAAPLHLTLPTCDAQAALRLGEARKGRGRAVVVDAVAAGSATEAAGVRPGLQVLEISDPIRLTERWPLDERVSLKFVRQALQMRRADTIDLVLAPLGDTPADGAAQVAGVLEAEVTAAAVVPGAAGVSFDDNTTADLLTAVTGSGQPPAPCTLGERLAAEYEKQQRAEEVAVTALERRIRRRKERLEAESQRSNGGVFAGVFALFLLPPLAILGWAWASGYLDQLQQGLY
eukprot:scaffold3.g6478.t1